MTNTKQKVYKENSLNNNNMNPGDPQGLPDDYFQEAFKLKKIINNIQVPGMVLRSNAGLPIHFYKLLQFKLRSKI